MYEDLDNKSDKILNSENQIRFQNAMNEVRRSFGENEANVYQQGEILIIRLKQIKFRSGSAAIPIDSIPLLSKINVIIKDLNPREVTIEGHTDATGKRDMNLMLSKKNEPIQLKHTFHL